MSFIELYAKPKQLETWLLYLLTVSFVVVAGATQTTIWSFGTDWTAEVILRWFKYHELTGNMLLGLASYGAILLAVESYRTSRKAAEDSEKAQKEMIAANKETVMQVKDLSAVMMQQWMIDLSHKIDEVSQDVHIRNGAYILYNDIRKSKNFIVDYIKDNGLYLDQEGIRAICKFVIGVSLRHDILLDSSQSQGAGQVASVMYIQGLEIFFYRCFICGDAYSIHNEIERYLVSLKDSE